jgi:signal transduction histidine kinase/ligand-binding sensor domain-containing protein
MLLAETASGRNVSPAAPADSWSLAAFLTGCGVFRAWIRFARLVLLASALSLSGASAPAVSTGGTNLPSLTGEYLVRQWTSDDGLPQNSVIAMSQTGDGYLWLSTFGGVARFDGIRFEVFDPDHVPGLAAYYLHLSADRKNGLWLSGAEGPAAHYSEGRFRSLDESDGLPGGASPRIATGPDGTLWAGSASGRLLRHDGRRFVVHAEAPRPDWGPLWQLVFDHAGRIWTEQVGEFAYFEGGRWHLIRPPGKGRAGSGIIPMPDGSVLIEGTPRGSHLLRHTGDGLELFDRFPFAVVAGPTYRLGGDGALWCLNQGPLLRRNNAGEWGEIGRDTPLAKNAHRSSLQDREGNLWVGTDGGGLFRLRRRGVRTVGTAEGLTRPVVLSVSGDSAGGVLAAVHGRGVQRFDGTRFRQVERDRELNAAQFAWCVLARPDGGAWVGTYGQGLIDVPAGDAPAVTFRATNAPGVLEGPHYALLEDSTGALWTGGLMGLSRRSQGRFRQWTERDGLAGNLVQAVADAGQGAVWAGGDRGLARVDERSVRTFSRTDGLAHDHVRALFADTDGTLWIGGGGLTRWKAGKFTAIRAANGLPVETIKSIISDNAGGLWWGTPNGIFRCAKRDLDAFCDGAASRVEPMRFDRSDGMPSNECSGYQPAVWKGPDGRLWFATLNGLAIIDPENLPENGMAPPVVVEAVLADGRKLEPQAGRFEIPAGTLLVEFRYTALSLAAAERNRFRCRLEGFDRGARDTGNQRVATYTKLPPGDYAFRVTAGNNDGVWNETGAAINVTVLPFFRETAAFRIIAGAALLTFAALSIRWLSQRTLRRRLAALEREQAVNGERARIARNMHDDVGASLTQIGLLSELAHRQMNDRTAAEARLQELAELSRDVVRNLDSLVWAVNPEHDTVAGLVDYLGSFAQEFLRPTGIACRFDLPLSPPDDPVPAAARHQVLLLVKEALNNAVKHSGATEVTVAANVSDGVLRFEIRDNGAGFDPSSAGRFNDGLANMRRRASAAGGTCEIISAPGRGTSVRVEMPVGR